MEFDVKRWRECWQAYSDWAAEHDTIDPRPWGAILRDIDFMYAHYRPEVRTADPDPEKFGIQNYYRILEKHDQLRRTRF